MTRRNLESRLARLRSSKAGGQVTVFFPRSAEETEREWIKHVQMIETGDLEPDDLLVIIQTFYNKLVPTGPPNGGSPSPHSAETARFARSGSLHSYVSD